MKTKCKRTIRINQKLLKPLLVLFCMSLTFYGYSQQGVSINTSGTQADPSAMLDVSSTSKGLLIPRVALTSINDVTTIASPATSLLVYNTNAAMTGGAVGFWYFNGTNWVQAIGPQGPIGATGPQGIQGLVGPVGATGAQGAQGLIGPVGATGAQGIQGLVGPAGATGAQGIQGLIGPVGATGAQGAQGIQGIPGTAGATGATGAAGAQGIQGPIGATGAAGAQGIQGPVGATGSAGAVGATGPAGPVGCATANMVIKSNGTTATCSQIFDDGTNVGIGTTSPGYKLQIDNYSIGNTQVKIGGSNVWSSGHDNVLYFGDGSYSYVGETYGDDVLTLYGSSGLRIAPYGNYGTSGQVLTTDGNYAYWANSAASGITGTCASGANYVPKMASATSITCSQILDNGTSVGIGTASPAQKLDVAGNVQFSGALMPAGAAGNAGQVLKSSGTGLAPTWSGAITASDIYSVESTAGIILTTSWQIVTGESITIPGLATGDRVIIQLSGNAIMSTLDQADVDVAPFVNGVMLAIGGYVRCTLDRYFGNTIWQNFASVARYTIPAAGSYTFDVRALMAGSGTVTVGGNSTQANEGVLVIYVLKN